MIKYFLHENYRLFVIVLHIIIGLLSIQSSIYVISWLYISFLVSIFFIKRFDKVNIAFLLAYFAPFELLARMAKSSPYIPYEFSKYLVFLLIIFGIFIKRPKFNYGLVLVFLLLPSIFFDLSGNVSGYKAIVFNLLGPLTVGLAIFLFYKAKISSRDYSNLLFLTFLPLLSSLSFVFFKTPDFSTIEFSLGANFETTGGFGSNQVSSAMGLGMFICFVFWVNNWTLSTNRTIDLFLTFAFAFQGLLSFSRGGMLGGLLVVFLYVAQLFFRSSDSSTLVYRKRVRALVVPAFFILFFSFFLANYIADGKLLLRYQGETTGTLSGAKEKTVATITTLRSEIFLEDAQLWFQYPLFGTGVGASKFLRESTKDIVAHVELSRLLSEHGLMGLFYSMVILNILFSLKKINRNNIYRYLQFCLFILAIYTTFHAAMRTYITPVLISFSLFSVINFDNKV